MDSTKTKAAGPRGTTAQENTLNRQDTSATNQRAIILQALFTGPKTTVELRESCGIMAPAVRIKELREMGHAIHTFRISVETRGIKHINVARYVYIRAPRGALHEDAGVVPGPPLEAQVA